VDVSRKFRTRFVRSGLHGIAVRTAWPAFPLLGSAPFGAGVPEKFGLTLIRMV